MEAIAADQSHGYSQQARWGPDYDCSSLVITALEQAGIPAKSKGATYTGNMRPILLSLGFKDIVNQVNLSTGKGLQRGDILLNQVHHTAVYAGNGKIVHARGQSYGSPRTGDQGQEIAVTAYYNYPWDCVLRYSGEEPAPSAYYAGICTVTLPELIDGCIGPHVKTAQILLNAKGYKGADGKRLDEDGEYGPNTSFAVECLQRDKKLSNVTYYGTVSARTWALLIG